MKIRIRFLGIMLSTALLSNCTITTAPTGYTDFNTGYTGYTVGYSYGTGNDDIGDGTYMGYGGWASSFFAPGYRYGYRPSGFRYP